MRIVDGLGDRVCGFGLLGFMLYFSMLLGCVERQELREQHCAHLAIERHGYRPPNGVYGTWTHGDRCYARLWSHTRVFEGHVGDDWRGE